MADRLQSRLSYFKPKKKKLNGTVGTFKHYIEHTRKFMFLKNDVRKALSGCIFINLYLVNPVAEFCIAPLSRDV